MPFTTRLKKPKGSRRQAVAEPARRAGKRGAGKVSVAGRRSQGASGPVDERAVRRAVGATMFDPAVFTGLYDQCAAERAAHWAQVKDGQQPPQNGPRKRTKGR